MKRIKLEYLVVVLALLFLSFTLGYFTGRNSDAGGAADTILIETAVTKEETATEAPVEADAAPIAAQSPEAETVQQDTAEPETEDAPQPVEAVFPLDLNRATAEELELLPGIGPTLAERIVSYRSDYGAFQTKEDLMLVSGIGKKRYAAVESMITVEEIP